jgi:hypothetical protein
MGPILGLGPKQSINSGEADSLILSSYSSVLSRYHLTPESLYESFVRRSVVRNMRLMKGSVMMDCIQFLLCARSSCRVLDLLAANHFIFSLG